MGATSTPSRTIARLASRRWYWLLMPIPLALAVVAALSWWFTEPLEDSGFSPRPAPTGASSVAGPSVPAPPRPSMPDWPEGRLEGDEAKHRLLAFLKAVEERLDGIHGYTATFRKQERIDGELKPEQALEMKVRHRPFSVYFKFINPQAGKEVVYAEGRHDNKVIAHAAGWGRRLIPRLAVPPTHPLALAENRHPITEAGLACLTRKLIGFREMDLTDSEAVTILDRTTGPDGRPALRSIHTHPHRKPERPFARVEVLYDPETKFPMRITSFDWPGDGHTGDLLLAECYAYDDLKLDVPLDDLDFDPANPDYAFHRF